MTRYVVKVGEQFVTAVHSETEWIGFTHDPDDAGSWVTYERAVAAAKVVASQFDETVCVHRVEEPKYPLSWRVKHV